MVLTARVCGVGFHAGESCAGIAMWGWPTYLSVVEGSELQLAHRNDLRADPEVCCWSMAIPRRHQPRRKSRQEFCRHHEGWQNLQEHTEQVRSNKRTFRGSGAAQRTRRSPGVLSPADQ